jgi:predicted amidohydrolase
MRIALYQCPSQPLDVEGNLARLQARAREAAQWDVELLVLPEMFLSGYNIGAGVARNLAQASDGANAEQVAQIARQFGLAIVYGYPELDERGNVYNSVQLIDRTGERLGNYRKTHLFGDADRAMFSAGEQAPAVLELNGWKLGLLICYDIEFPENARRLALDGAELILVPTANMTPYDFICQVTVRARAQENQCYLVYANYCGAEHQIQYCGQSSIVGPDGSLLAMAGREECLLLADLDRERMLRGRQDFPYLMDLRRELHGLPSAD